MDKGQLPGGTGSQIGTPASAGATEPSATGLAAPQSRTSFRRLAEALLRLDQEYLGEKHGITTPKDIADGHRFLAHLLQRALDQQFEMNPDWPVLKRSVTPTLKINGDNPDAIIYYAYIRSGRRYRLSGNLARAVYFSISVQTGGSASYGAEVGAALNDTAMSFEEDGSFEVIISPDDPGHRNWLKLPPDAVSITTRHYFEEQGAVAADYGRHLGLAIAPIDEFGPFPEFDDAAISAGLERVIAYMNARTIDQPQAGDGAAHIAWVSREANQIPDPLKPGKMAYAAVDNAYAMAPFRIADDEALVIRGRWPKCRYASVVLWNRYLQSFDYAHRRVWLNRAQTKADADGNFVMVIAHRDPGVPNWIDTCGNNEGTMYWRFLLPEGDIETPVATLVKFADL